jgi:acetyltransferase-like isoleucine patch superfamily enzyme
MGRLRACRHRLSGVAIGRGCSIGRYVDFVYGWRTCLGDGCIIDDFVQFKCPTSQPGGSRCNIVLEENVVVGRGTIIDSNLSVKIGANTLIAPGCFITDTKHRYDDPDRAIFNQGWEYKPVVIGADVWLGAHCVVQQGVTIGTGSILAAGTVVAEDMPPMVIASGIPAKVRRHR